MRLMKVMKTAGCLAAGGLCGGEAMAATTVFRQSGTYQTGDSTIRSDQAGTNYGQGSYLITGRTSAGVIRSVFSFSLADIPAGSTITGVTLTLTGERNDSTSADEAVSLELYRLTTSFQEGASDVNGNNGDGSGVTWNRSSTGNAWTAGGSFSSQVSSLTVNANPRSNAGVVATFGTTINFVAAAQAALDAGTDLSLLMKLSDANEASATRRAFFYYAGEETSTTSDRSGVRPGLTVTYTVPEPTTLLLGALGCMSLIAPTPADLRGDDDLKSKRRSGLGAPFWWRGKMRTEVPHSVYFFRASETSQSSRAMEAREMRSLGGLVLKTW